jgi:excinuclease UvrABC nuclease subunit
MAVELSNRISFADAEWSSVPDQAGVYVIYDLDEVIYVGMAGRNGKGSLRNRLKDHASGQIVNMFAQYLFLARVQFVGAERITHPRNAKAACREYLVGRCSFQFAVTAGGAEARALEERLRRELGPALNGQSVDGECGDES